MRSLYIAFSHKIICFSVAFVVSTTNSGVAAENESTNEANHVQLTTDGQAVQTPLYKYIGSSFSKKFHRPSCQFAKAISKHHLVLFLWRKEAIAANYQPCKYCLPPVWLTTHCVLLYNGAKRPPNEQASKPN